MAPTYVILILFCASYIDTTIVVYCKLGHVSQEFCISVTKVQCCGSSKILWVFLVDYCEHGSVCTNGWNCILKSFERCLIVLCCSHLRSKSSIVLASWRTTTYIPADHQGKWWMAPRDHSSSSWGVKAITFCTKRFWCSLSYVGAIWGVT